MARTKNMRQYLKMTETKKGWRHGSSAAALSSNSRTTKRKRNVTLICGKVNISSHYPLSSFGCFINLQDVTMKLII
jgi:hypothetical protein